MPTDEHMQRAQTASQKAATCHAPRGQARIRLVVTPTILAEHHETEEFEKTQELEKANATRPKRPLSHHRTQTSNKQRHNQRVNMRQVAMPMDCTTPCRAGNAAATAASEHLAMSAIGIRESSCSMPTGPSSSRRLLTAGGRSAKEEHQHKQP